MKKVYINIPEGILHLSDYQQLQNQFPQTSFILDKKVTGCGATTMFLADDVPTILCSPRKELMYCKARSKEFQGRVHLFRDEGEDDMKVIDLENRVIQYINSCNSPFSELTPKIIVTYDSFKHVAQRLKEDGTLGRFRIIVDEAQTLFTDAAFKGGVEMEFFTNVSQCRNVIYLSATPYIEDYLDQIQQFSGIPYVKLIWPESAVHSANIEKLPYHKGSPTKTAVKIIQEFIRQGYFKDKLINGVEVSATEAVFFVNNVSLIIRIIKNCGLTPDTTNVICADDDKNVSRLKSVGFTIGHAPGKGEPHKTFTFVTRCSFEGTDFYSPCAYTYIFTDARMESMAYDISLDLPQIMGRQRRADNPFRYDATFYYKADPDFSEKEHIRRQMEIRDKATTTTEVIDNLNNISNQRARNNMLNTYRNRKDSTCEDDYVAVVDDEVAGTRRAVFNTLAMFNEIRSWEIQKGQYQNGCQVMRAVNDATKPLPPEICQFLEAFRGDFECRMRMYSDFLCCYPELKGQMEELPQIPMAIKQYFNLLGPGRLHALSYVEARIQNELNAGNLQDALLAQVASTFIPGQFYPLKNVKSMLQDIYNDLGIGRTAKATDLSGLIPYRVTKQIVEGVRENGVVIG